MPDFNRASFASETLWNHDLLLLYTEKSPTHSAVSMNRGQIQSGYWREHTVSLRNSAPTMKHRQQLWQIVVVLRNILVAGGALERVFADYVWRYLALRRQSAPQPHVVCDIVDLLAYLPCRSRCQYTWMACQQRTNSYFSSAVQHSLIVTLVSWLSRIALSEWV